MNITFLELEEWEKPMLRNNFSGHSLNFYEEALTQNNLQLIIKTEILSPFIYSTLSKDILSQLPNLKLIATRSTGFDHIDVNYCKERGITVCNVPTYGVNTVAEHTFSLILALSKKIVPSVENTRQGNFDLDGLRGIELANKTLGIIGLGHIGLRVAEIGRCFKMKIIAYTPHPNIDKAQGVTFCDLTSLLSTSDFITLHVPATPDSNHLINKENIKLLKKGSFLINTARGVVVETEAILWALEQGILGGVGLDVLEEECVLKEERELLSKDFLKTCNLKTQLLNHVLLTKKNVIVTPHNAFNSYEALQEILDTTVINIENFLDGQAKNQIL
ncbi:MAG: hydroxyacid dehydrogenase [Candidatus Roizmanbacteria bacterium]|nr:MAG: hydroxyacid dehydrogenase [Candidatus Roizmanbacteria bacterium]